MVSRVLFAGDVHEEEESSSESESESEAEEVTSEEEGADEADQEAGGSPPVERDGNGGAAGATPRSTIQQRKLSIKLGANVCHVSQHTPKTSFRLPKSVIWLHSNMRLRRARSLSLCTAGVRRAGPLCWLCGRKISGLSEQALLPVQRQGTQHHDLPLQARPAGAADKAQPL